MALLVVVFVVALVACTGGGVLAHRYGAGVSGPLTWGRALAGRVGALPAAAIALVAGWVVTGVVGLGLGFTAKALEGSLDKPVFRWIDPRVHAGNLFTKANEKLTLIGNNPIIQLVVLVSTIVLAFAYRRRWWIPVILVPVSLYGEKYLQKFLGHTVHRGHPPTTLGTYPSGGVGRILAVWGTVIALTILLHPSLTRAWRVGLWTGVVTAAVVESFSRVYLSKHWLTDAVFGLPFGALLLLTNVTAVGALTCIGTRRRTGA